MPKICKIGSQITQTIIYYAPEGISLALILASCKSMKCSVTPELSSSLLV